MFNIGRLDGSWNLSRVDRLEVTDEEAVQYRLSKCDILINRVNSRELVGKCAVVGDSTSGCVFESKNMRLRLKLDLAQPDFVAAWLNSEGGHNQIASRLKQIVGQATINRDDLDSLLVPLPPIEDQQRITATLFEHLEHIRRARAAAETQLEAIERLPAVLLRRVFAGEL